ncbi:MAG TPA: hypothetical protein ENI72_01790, partial [Rhodospirillales bacterium]|nr:hypothetical protein [Rhodospirillales bacterium]
MIKTNAAPRFLSPHRIMVFFLALWVFSALPTGAVLAQSAAGASSTAKTDFTDLKLGSATETTGNVKKVSLGLQFKLKKGWKVYWRTAGDAGYPPQLDWKGSENLESATIRWPVPVRYSILG